jgi:ubiquinone/menaquinone biosynthesis C-methylase UbiE
MNTEQSLATQKRYNRQAGLYDVTEAPIELLLFRRFRRKLWNQVSGERVLEIGVGTGKNLSYHPRDARVVCVDLSPRMLRRAAARADRIDRRVDFVLADAQRLPFRDGAFGAAAATFVFCSVPDPVAGLREARRVTREDGALHLLEHVRSSNRVIGWLMDRLNPLVVRVSGANINRDTVSNAARAGLDVEELETAGLGILKLIRGSRADTRLEAGKDVRSVAHV